MPIDKQTIFEKTPKGINESKGRWGVFADKRQKILALIDGKLKVEELIAASGMKEKKLLPELEALLLDRLIRESWIPAAEFTINEAHQTPQAIYVTVANTQAYMEAVEKRKSAEAESDEELISLDDITEKLQRESEQQAKRDEAGRQLQIEAKVKAESERLAREEAERKAREEAERAAREEVERKAREEEERLAREEAERKAREEAERAAREEVERKAREEEERLAREEAERKAREEAERTAREEAERKAREDRIAKRLKAREEEERRAREAAERKAQEAAERAAREEAERKAREEAERVAREEAERKAREKEERHIREEAERKAREEAERTVREEAERQAKEDKARRALEEIERKVREEADLAAREEVDRKAREEEKRRAREEAERKTQEESERLAREETERQAKVAEEQLARAEAERKAQEEAERQAKAEKEQRTREEAERKAQEEADHASHKEAERQAKEEEARSARAETERKAQEKAERKAREEAEKIAQKETKRIAREEGKFGDRMAGLLPKLKWAAAGGVALLVLVLVGIHFVPLSSSRTQLEKLATMKLGEPVKIQAVHIALFPSPHLKLEQIQIGSQGNSRIANAAIHAGWGTLLGSGSQVERIELEKIDLAPGMLEAAAVWPARNTQQQPAYQIAQITLRHMQLAANNSALPSFKGEFNFASSGKMDKAWLGSEDGALRADFSPSPEGLGVSISASEVTPFYFLPFKISSLRAAAKVGERKIRFDDLEGTVSGGKLSGSLTLSWDSGWSMAGDLRIAGANIAASSAKTDSPVVSGKLDAALGFSRQATLPENLLGQPLLTGSVTLREGTITGFDLPATLHYGVEAIYTGQTPYDAWSFKLEPAGDRQAYKTMRMTGKGLLLEGNGEVAAKGALSGLVKLAVDTKQKTVRGSYKLDGTLGLPTIHPASN